jgi:hypothetical protein
VIDRATSLDQGRSRFTLHIADESTG